MKRRCLLVAGLVGFVVLSLLGSYWIFRSPINEENYSALKVDMTIAEVEAVFGPASEETSGLVNTPKADEDANATRSDQVPRRMTWRGDSIVVTAHFSEDGRLEVADAEYVETTILGIRRWLGIDVPTLESIPDGGLRPYRVYGGVGPASSSLD